MAHINPRIQWTKKEKDLSDSQKLLYPDRYPIENSLGWNCLP
jgi:hypothetical protein